jgi:hypothetical protein
MKEFEDLKNDIDEQLFGSLEFWMSSFLKNDMFLVWEDDSENKVYEVAISCKIWRYIESYLEDIWFFEQYIDFRLDTEYDKMHIDKIDKLIPWIREICWNKTDKIRPDIVIHKRWLWWTENNYCVFEIKKWNLSECDRTKLLKMTDDNDDTVKNDFWYKYWIWISNFKGYSIRIALYMKWKIKNEYIYNKQ